VEPEIECWIESEAFDDVLETASTIRKRYPEATLFHSHPLAQERESEALNRRAIRDAMLGVIGQHAATPLNLSFFASLPDLVEGYLVSAVLGVQTDILDGYHRLSTDVVAIHKYRTWPVSRSLIDAAIAEVLSEASDGLLRPDPGLRFGRRQADEIIRTAAQRLALDTAFRANPGGIEGCHGFYDACNRISALRYETAEGSGKLVLARKEHEAVKTWIAFIDEIALKDHRRSRKLLELARHGNALHTDSECIFGLVDGNVPNNNKEDIFEVRFLGHHHWELCHSGHVLMTVRFGEPSLPKITNYELKLRQDLPRLFMDVKDEAIDLLVSLVRQAGQERHGTLLVISSEAAEEANRLRNQSTPIAARLLTSELLSHLTGIDGAVLVDPNGYCHAIGVILDGLATAQGNPARGARFNSALRYVEFAASRNLPVLAVIVSEDGGVDFIPNLRPRIKRSLVTQAIDELEEIPRAGKIVGARHNQLYEGLRKLRFYLLGQDCARVNMAIQEIDRKLTEQDPMAVRIVHEIFEPHPEMESSFYFTKE
jgi:DNA integrity scanning protein DisA with diadenylate cyclase activity